MMEVTILETYPYIGLYRLGFYRTQFLRAGSILATRDGRII